jgi:hypothetical protein
MSVKRYYRLSPVLWNNIPGQTSAPVYSIDRPPEGPLTQYVTCTPRCSADPAYTWAGPTFIRLTMPRELVDWQIPGIANSVVWANLPSWLSFAQGIGYSLPDNFQFAKIKPTDDLTLIFEVS